MTQNVFFVCESCRLATEESEESEAAGTTLLKELQQQHQNWSRQSEFEIQGVGCLCTCHQPCVFALAGRNKPSYLFAGLPAQGMASAILTLGDFYANKDNGFVPNYKLPEVLQVARLARIPPWPQL